MTPRALKKWRLRLDMTQDAFARWLGVSRSTVNRWEGGTQAIPKMLGLLEREHTANARKAPVEAIVSWALATHWEAVGDHLDLSDEELGALKEEAE